MLGIHGTHSRLKTLRNIFFADGSDSLDVELAVEEMGINPFTAAPEKIVVFLRATDDGSPSDHPYRSKNQTAARARIAKGQEKDEPVRPHNSRHGYSFRNNTPLFDCTLRSRENDHRKFENK